MKKKLFMFLTLIFFMPFVVNASGKCNIVSGNGWDIGSEIECAGEHFYIINSNRETGYMIMLAKYNLDIGSVANKITVSEERYNEIKELCLGSSYCNLMYQEPEFIGYERDYYHEENEDGTHTYFVYRNLEPEIIKQSSNAIGAHGNTRGEPEFPEYGVTGFISSTYEEVADGEIYNTEFRNFLISNKTKFYSLDSLNEYEYTDYIHYLTDNGIDVGYYDILTIDFIDDIIYNITGNRLPLDEWVNNKKIETSENYSKTDYSIYGSIKDYLPEGYDWLYSTTYWTRTGKVNKTNFSGNVFFVDTLGNICSQDGCNIAIGAGIRPVIGILNDMIDYSITTKSNENGTIENKTNSEQAGIITLKVNPKANYKLKKLIVSTDMSDDILEISENDIIQNNDGTISINPEILKKPFANIVIEAVWEFTNPKTGVLDVITSLFIGLLMSLGGFYLVKNYNERIEI